VIFASFFLWRGAAALDEGARGISWKTRALLFPGSVALWPVLLRKWLKARNQA
jgi:membrane protein implicated in regulation of membrane protease activity